MIIDHTHPLYKEKRNKQGYGKYNGAYYYSKDIVKHIIPNVKTDRNWVTVRIEKCPVPDHSIVFVHNNRNPNLYEYVRKAKDVILVCSTMNTYENMKFFGTPIYLPLSINIENVKKYKVKDKTKEMAFAGRRLKITNRVPADADILTDMPQSRLLKEMAKYKKIFAVGLTAIQAKVLGCEIMMYDPMYPDVKFWKVVDCKEAVKILQSELDKIDKEACNETTK